jgi:aminoglycoside/choline kinase family phosphotransferase
MTPTPSARANEGIVWPDDERRSHFERWLAPLANEYALDVASLAPASADASFRRYLRIQSRERSFVVMDAPPPQEDVRPFVRIARRISSAGLHAPQVLAADEARGFLLLSDLGRTLYLDALRQAPPADADRLMREAIAALVQWQMRLEPDGLPPYDDALLRRAKHELPDFISAILLFSADGTNIGYGGVLRR